MPAEKRYPQPGAIFWLAVLWIAAVVASAATADFWAVPTYDEMDWDNLRLPPGKQVGAGAAGVSHRRPDSPPAHWLGTDTMGRDIVARLIHGARISLAVGICSPLIGLLAGGLLGCLAGYFRGRWDALIVAAMDIILAFPGLVLLLTVTFYLGPSLGNLILTLGFLSIPAFSRVARAKTLAISGLEFVNAARLSGAGHATILLREILPNVVIPLAAYGLLVSAFMIMAEGAISFLGLGVPAPIPSWGGMIAEGREVLEEAPHISMIPAAVMFLTVLSFNLIGDGLRSLVERKSSQL